MRLDYFLADLTVREGGTETEVLTDQRYDVADELVGETGRLSVLFDASAYETGFYEYELTLTTMSDTAGPETFTEQTLIVTGRVAVVNRADSEFGNRWSMPLLDRLDVDEAATGGVGFIGGHGATEFFAASSGGYDSPADVLASLAAVIDGSGATTGYELSLADGTTKHFDVAGLLTRIVQRDGREATFTYADADGDSVADELATFTGEDGYAATFTYTNGLLSSVSDGRGMTYSYVHNADGTLAKIVFPPANAGGSNPEHAFTYDPTTKQMVSETDRAGRTTTITYGADRRVRTIDRPGDAFEQRTPAQIAGLTQVVLLDDVVTTSVVNGQERSWQFDPLGNLAEETDARGNVTRYVRDGRGLVTEARTANPSGGDELVTKFAYNARGNVTKVTNADGTYREYVYAANGLDLLSERDERGKVWTYTVDAAGNRLTATDPLGKVTTYTYTADGRGNLETETLPDPDGAGPLTASVTTYTYDTRDRVTRVDHPDGTYRTYVFDDATDTLTSETDERGHTTSYTYDDYRRVRTMTLPDPDGATGPLAAPVYSYGYCGCGALNSVTDPLGRVTAYEYDDAGNLESVTSPDPDDAGPLLPLVTTYTYDAFGRRLSETAPGPTGSQPTTFYEYDGNGNLTKVTLPDPDGAGPLVAAVWEYAYDELNRLVQVTEPAGDAPPVLSGLRSELLTSTYGQAGDLPVAGDWDGDGVKEIGVFRAGVWWLDLNGDGIRNAGDGTPNFGGLGDDPIAGDWDGDGDDDIGVYRDASFHAAFIPGGGYDPFGLPGDVPVVGDWNGDGDDDYGIFRDGTWYLDLSGNDAYGAGDVSYTFGQAGDMPVAGDWNGDGVDEIGVYRDGTWMLDLDGDGVWESGSDLTILFGDAGDIPVAGKWRADSAFGIGVFDSATAAWERESFGYAGSEVAARVTNYTYDAVGNLISEETLGRVTAYEYDEAGNLTQLTSPDPDGAGALPAPVTRYAYDDAGRLMSETVSFVGATAADERTTTSVYDAAGRLIETTLPDPDGTAGPKTSPVHTFGYDLRHRLAWEEDPLGNRTSYGYDAAGNRTTVTLPDPDGGGPQTSPVHTYAYDWLNRLTSETGPDPDGAGPLAAAVTTYGYGATDQLLFVEPPATGRTDYAYDAVGRLLTESGPDPDAGGPLGRAVTGYAYDAHGRLATLTGPDPDGAGAQTAPVTTYAYDLAGRTTSVTDALGAVTSYVYDVLGRPVHVTTSDPDGAGTQSAAVRRYEYDSFGQLVAEVDLLGHRTTYAYDALGRRTSDTDPLQGVTAYAYDAYGNLASLTDPVSNVTGWTYDALNRITVETDPRGEPKTFDYDAASRLVEKVDRLGRVTEYAYDGLNRLLTETWFAADGVTLVNTVAHAYDAASRLTSISDAGSVYAYEYDAAGRMTEVDNSGTPGAPNLDVVLTSSYDLAGRRTGLDATLDGVADLSNSYTYDDAGRMTRVEQFAGGPGTAPVADKRVDLAYDLLSRINEIVRYEDLAGTLAVATTGYGFDSAGRLTSILHEPGNHGSPAFHVWAYGYDAADRLISDTTSTIFGQSTITYDYDATDQLTAVDRPSSQPDESYAYDANGNRTGTGTGHQTQTGNRLVSDGTYDYLYDDEGNRTRKTTIATGDYVEYGWDHRNRLMSVTFKTAAGVTAKQVTYRYDVHDRRIAKDVDETGDGTFDRGEWFVYDGEQIVLRTDRGGAVTNRYLHGPEIDQVFADESAVDGILWALADRQGTVRSWADYDPGSDWTSIVNGVGYDGYGNITSQTSSPHEPLFAYTGREWDADAELYYYRARWYDAAVGEFVSEDPSGFAAGDANLGRYVGNSPTNYTDPEGKQAARPWYDPASSTPGGKFPGMEGFGTDDLNDAISGILPLYRPFPEHDPPEYYTRLNEECDQAAEDLFQSIPFMPGTGMLGPKGGFGPTSGWPKFGSPRQLFGPGGILGPRFNQPTKAPVPPVAPPEFHGPPRPPVVPAEPPPISVVGGGLNRPRTGSVGDAFPTPWVSNPKLNNLVNDLYKGAKGPNPIGTGSTADAVRNELCTGLPTHGRFHSQKAQEYMNALEKWLRNYPHATYQDRLAAQSILDDLTSALGGN